MTRSGSASGAQVRWEAFMDSLNLHVAGRLRDAIIIQARCPRCGSFETLTVPHEPPNQQEFSAKAQAFHNALEDHWQGLCAPTKDAA